MLVKMFFFVKKNKFLYVLFCVDCRPVEHNGFFKANQGFVG